MNLVFISHVAEDRTLAVRIAQGLEAAGFSTWYYERDSLPGPSYLDQILGALARTSAVVALVSPTALTSGQVEKEVVQAHERGLPFIPLLHGITHDELRAARPAWAMAFGAAVSLPLPAHRDVAALLPQIVAGARWLRGERATAPAVAPIGAAAPAPAPHVDNLPVPPGPLIGRAQAVAQLTALLHQPAVRLVTLTGPGGVGKTRLAVQVATEMREDCPNGVCFVNLAPLADPALVASAIAQAMGIKEVGGQLVAETLQAALREQTLLLVPDNYEQVASAAPLVAELLASCPGLKVLATSRVPLHLRGEREVVVAPLAVPDLAQLPDVPTLSQFAAVALFIARAREVKADFSVTTATAPAIATICARLDGLPLAIELAAARVRLFSPPALLGRLSNRLALLTGGARDTPARQRTLRATIDWSYSLLDAEQQTLFARLSVFAGGRTLEAIEAICNAEGRLDVLAGMEVLVAQSMVQQTEVEGEMRFVLLETIQEYAGERLAERGEADAVRQAHAAYFLALAEEAQPRVPGPEQAAWLARLEREHDNLRAALHWTVHERSAGGVRLAWALFSFWEMRGHLSEGRGWLEAALARESTAAAATRANALHGAGILAWLQGDYGRAVLLYEESLALWRELGDTRGIARSLNTLGSVLHDQGEAARAAALYEESLALERAVGDTRGIAQSLNNLGNVVHDQGDDTRAAALYEESLMLRRALEDTRGIAQSLINLGNVARTQGDYGRAVLLYEESLALQRAVGDMRNMVLSLSNLGLIMHDQGDDTRAAALYQEALTVARQLGLQAMIAGLLMNLGEIARGQGDTRAARARYVEGLSMNRTIGDQHVLAYGLEGLGGVALAQGQATQAARLLGAGAALRARIGAPLVPVEQAVYDRDVAAARGALGTEAFAAAWAEGQALPLEQAVAVALHGPDDAAAPGRPAGGPATLSERA